MKYDDLQGMTQADLRLLVITLAEALDKDRHEFRGEAIWRGCVETDPVLGIPKVCGQDADARIHQTSRLIVGAQS